MIRKFAPIPRKSVPSPFDLSSLFQQYQQLERLRAETITAHDKWLAEADKKLSDMIASVKIPAKGDKGDMPIPGIHFPIPKDGKSVNHDEVVAEVVQKIKQPPIDHAKIARIAATLIKPPQPKQIDHDLVAEKVVELITTGKKKLNIKNIEGFNEGLEQTIAPIRHLAAGFRGGGDTVAAGSNITITTNNGVKTISSSGGSATIYSETPTGLIDGANKTYTTAHTINTVIGLWYNGEFIHPAEYTVSGAGFTMNTALPVIQGAAFTISYT